MDHTFCKFGGQNELMDIDRPLWFLIGGDVEQDDRWPIAQTIRSLVKGDPAPLAMNI